MKAIVIRPYLKRAENNLKTLNEYRLSEAVSLAETLELSVEGKFLVALNEINSASFIGSGKVTEFQEIIKEQEIEVVFIDEAITPVQQRNLKKAFGTDVLDRTGIIIEIFSKRARTKEGRLQVELAQLEYHKSRLVHLWSHLERQRGSMSFIGGPGETQIELDKRIIEDKIKKLKEKLQKVARTREIHRKNREVVPYPVVALVGYTNAGKSTLFNALSNADVYVENKLFATLDPTMRLIELPNNQKIILSDTVGFISELPTQLVAAFRATLEEVLEADLLLHVRDVADPNAELHKKDVIDILKQIGVQDKLDNSYIEVWNKVDLLEENVELDQDAVAISAAQKHNLDALMLAIQSKISNSNKQVELSVHITEGKLISWLHENGKILHQELGEDGNWLIKADLSPINISRLQAMSEEHDFNFI